MRTIIWIMVIILMYPGYAKAGDERHLNAPSRLPFTQREMNTAGFWIANHPTPDKVIMAPAQIKTFNEHVQNELHLTKDIFNIVNDLKTETLVTGFDKTLYDYGQKGYYNAAGVRDEQVYLEKARRNMNLTGVVLGVAPRYGLVVHYADVRFFPMDDPLYESAGDIDFDQVQNSTLDVGTPVAVVHQSTDRKWYYVLSPNADGWVQADRIAVGDMKVVKAYATSARFAVATAPKADLFLNEGMSEYHDYVRMGTRLPIVAADADIVTVQVPEFDEENNLTIVKGYVPADQVNDGYLPYTARTIMNQAFAMLHQPYGWGGMYGEQDCSALINEIYATVGVLLPRDSKDQAKTGQVIADFEDKITHDVKLKTLSGIPGESVGSIILPMKGHIMLFLGMYNSRAYVLHAVWAYRERRGENDLVRIINGVTVSDIYLGDGSTKGSLIKRLSKIVTLQ